MTPTPTRRTAIASLGAAVAGAAAQGFRTFGQPAPAAAAERKPAAFALTDYERLAREHMTHPVWEYIQSGSGDEVTVQWNREALNRLRLEPRVMLDVSKIDLGITLLGRPQPHPILIAPTAAHMQVHPEGELATVRGAGAAHAVLVASTVSNRSIGDITAAATQPVWFQLYVAKDRGRTRDLIQRAEAAGCRALCITVDLPINYASNRIARVLGNLPHLPLPNLDIAAAPLTAIRGLRSDTFDWKELAWVQSFARLPIVLKGVTHPEDADRAVEAGIAGIIVSNHGGRALDTALATIEALPRVADRVAGRIPVLMDGGIRRGTDVLKALASGATAVLVGRPVLHALAVNGADGVRHVIDLLRTELEGAMALVGATTIRGLTRSVLAP